MLHIGMSLNELLTESNFIMYAMKAYDNPHCSDLNEFQDDLKRIKYIKRLLNRYLATGVLKDRLILNHIIVVYNVFGTEAATKILFFKLEPRFWPSIKTFLTYLHYLPDRIDGISSSDIMTVDIPLDQGIIKILREI